MLQWPDTLLDLPHLGIDCGLENREPIFFAENRKYVHRFLHCEKDNDWGLRSFLADHFLDSLFLLLDLSLNLVVDPLSVAASLDFFNNAGEAAEVLLKYSE